LFHYFQKVLAIFQVAFVGLELKRWKIVKYFVQKFRILLINIPIILVDNVKDLFSLVKIVHLDQFLSQIDLNDLWIQTQALLNLQTNFQFLFTNKIDQQLIHELFLIVLFNRDIIENLIFKQYFDHVQILKTLQTSITLLFELDFFVNIEHFEYYFLKKLNQYKLFLILTVLLLVLYYILDLYYHVVNHLLHDLNQNQFIRDQKKQFQQFIQFLRILFQTFKILNHLLNLVFQIINQYLIINLILKNIWKTFQHFELIFTIKVPNQFLYTIDFLVLLSILLLNR